MLWDLCLVRSHTASLWLSNWFLYWAIKGRVLCAAIDLNRWEMALSGLVKPPAITLQSWTYLTSGLSQTNCDSHQCSINLKPFQAHFGSFSTLLTCGIELTFVQKVILYLTECSTFQSTPFNSRVEGRCTSCSSQTMSSALGIQMWSKTVNVQYPVHWRWLRSFIDWPPVTSKVTHDMWEELETNNWKQDALPMTVNRLGDWD